MTSPFLTTNTSPLRRTALRPPTSALRPPASILLAALAASLQLHAAGPQPPSPAQQPSASQHSTNNPQLIHPLPSPEPGWPQFRGPHRNGISPEKNLLQSWPDDGPPLLWTATNLGSGYSAPIIYRPPLLTNHASRVTNHASHFTNHSPRLYITGDVADELHIFALDLHGNLLWRATNGASWRGPYPGARAACTYANNRIFHINAHGRLASFDAGTGQPLWHLDVIPLFNSRVPTWAIAECLLVDNGRVIVTPGGATASMAALDANTGKTIWTTEPLSEPPPDDSSPQKPEGPAYAPPILLSVHGQKHIVGVTARHFFGVNADTGKLQWQFPFPTRYEVIGSSPALAGDGIYITGPDAGGGKFLRFTHRDGLIGVEQTWTSTMDTCHGGIIALDGFLYGSWYRAFNGWGAVNAANGEVPYRDRAFPMGSALYADGRLYCLSQSGTMALVRPNPETWDVISKFQFVNERKNDVWAHPVILDGRLYLRHQQTLSCYNLRP